MAVALWLYRAPHVWNQFEGACYFVVLRATPVSVIRETMKAMGLNHVFDAEAACLVDPYAYDDHDRYYVRKGEPS